MPVKPTPSLPATSRSLPKEASACLARGRRLQEAGRYDEAEAAYRAALLLAPDHLDAYNDLGLVLQAAGRIDDALVAYREVLQRSPDNHIACNNIGSALQLQGQFEAAIEHYQRVLALEPRFAIAHFNLGTCLLRMGRLAQSVAWFGSSIEHDPQLYLAHNNLSSILNELGRTDEAIAVCRVALAINPAWSDMHSNMLFSLSHGGLDADALFVEHQRYAAQFEAPWRQRWPRHANTRDPARVLRVGFVSADLNNHAMANFITPILENLVDVDGLELHVYCNNRIDDHITARLRALIPNWRDIQPLSDVQFARHVTADSIDILIDLSGHSGHNRLPAFARKPAPLQISWLGYAMTTGLQAMDYYISDAFMSPPGLLDGQFTEKLLLLPAGGVYLPVQDMPPVAPSPAASNGHITFGSFNRSNKLSRKLIARWASLLHAVPTAKMVVAAMPDEHTTDKIRAWFVAEGIAPERLSFHARTSQRDYMALHRLVDVCLDSAPYPGGTTTHNALWMGVPTLTMSGPTLLSRIGAAIAGHVGLHDYIAHDEADFLRKGMAIAADIGRLAAQRGQLRARFAESAMGQPALVAAGLDHGLRTIWQRWCARLPAVALSADPTQSALSRRAKSNQALHAVNIDAALLLALEHHQQERLVEAETLYLAILHAQPAHAIANHNMGLLARQIGYHARSLPYFRAAAQAAPGESQFIASHAQALLQDGQHDAALAVLSAAIASGCATEQLRALLAQAEAAASAGMAGPTQAEADHLVALYESGRLAEMETAAHSLVACHPDSGFAWSVLGTALQAQGKDALPTLQRAVQLAPDDAQAHGNLGNAWQGVGEYGAAIDCYARALALEPDFAEALGNMGSALHAIGDLAGAAQRLREAVQFAPGYALAHANLGNVLEAMADLDGAATHYRAALALVPDDAQLHHDLGRVLQAQGQSTEAQHSFAHANRLLQGDTNSAIK